MTTFGLIRHGITEWNDYGKAQGISDIPLNNIGIKQAQELANRLSKEEEWDVIISSDLSRAIETAQIISDNLKLTNCMMDERIREINCGEIEGTTEEERIQKWGTSWRELDLGMEKFEDVAMRGIEFLEEAVITYKDKRVLIVSHGAFIGLTLKRLLPEKFTSTYIDNTSITILQNIENKWECSLYNCTKHLNRS
ncbi:histidine phosphatase family protein [Psychrobacillus vulpis]|uniref:Histidine phosphatase family protein n=1 Tax=Psychrobacillus vulpis TaxID=2325572 RepID=A0A544TNY1_9BACI|nr:histidine phosphatase family protein [Psychrobacillus vulpis]TQR19166.1 histidine phosphatase family protein [Psychrobacillus vulpis]